MTFGAFAMMFHERQMISKVRTHLEIGVDSVCYDVLPSRHCKPKRDRKPSRTLTIEHDPGCKEERHKASLETSIKRTRSAASHPTTLRPRPTMVAP